MEDMRSGAVGQDGQSAMLAVAVGPSEWVDEYGEVHRLPAGDAEEGASATPGAPAAAAGGDRLGE